MATDVALTLPDLGLLPSTVFPESWSGAVVQSVRQHELVLCWPPLDLTPSSVIGERSSSGRPHFSWNARSNTPVERLAQQLLRADSAQQAFAILAQTMQEHSLRNGPAEASAHYAAAAGIDALFSCALDHPPCPLRVHEQSPPSLSDAPLSTANRLALEDSLALKARLQRLIEQHQFSRITLDAQVAPTLDQAQLVLDALSQALSAAQERLGADNGTLGLHSALELRVTLRDDGYASAQAPGSFLSIFRPQAPQRGVISLDPVSACEPGFTLSDVITHEWTHALDWSVGCQTAPDAASALFFSEIPPDLRDTLNPVAAQGLREMEQAIFQTELTGEGDRLTHPSTRLLSSSQKGGESRHPLARATEAQLQTQFSQALLRACAPRVGTSRPVAQIQGALSDEASPPSLFGRVGARLPLGEALRCAHWLAWSSSATTASQLKRAATQFFLSVAQTPRERSVLDPVLWNAAQSLLVGARLSTPSASLPFSDRAPAAHEASRAAFALGELFGQGEIASIVTEWSSRQIFPDAPQPQVGPFSRASAQHDGEQGTAYWRQMRELAARTVGRPSSLTALVRTAHADAAQAPLLSLAQQRALNHGLTLLAQAQGLRVQPPQRLVRPRLEAFAALAQQWAAAPAPLNRCLGQWATRLLDTSLDTAQRNARALGAP